VVVCHFVSFKKWIATLPGIGALNLAEEYKLRSKTFALLKLVLYLLVPKNIDCDFQLISKKDVTFVNDASLKLKLGRFRARKF
jgi:hypothetical protein